MALTSHETRRCRKNAKAGLVGLVGFHRPTTGTIDRPDPLSLLRRLPVFFGEIYGVDVMLVFCQVPAGQAPDAGLRALAEGQVHRL